MIDEMTSAMELRERMTRRSAGRLRNEWKEGERNFAAKQDRKESAEDQTGRASSAQSKLQISGNETWKRNEIREKRANLREDDGFLF